MKNTILSDSVSFDIVISKAIVSGGNGVLGDKMTFERFVYAENVPQSLLIFRVREARADHGADNVYLEPSRLLKPEQVIVP